MEPIGICGGGLVALCLLLIAVLGLIIVAGGIVLILVKLGVIVNLWSKPKDRGTASDYTLDQSGTPDENGSPTPPA